MGKRESYANRFEGISLEFLPIPAADASELAHLAVAQFNQPDTAECTNEGPRNVRITEAEYRVLLRRAGRGRTLACYVLGRTEALATKPDMANAIQSIREACNEEVRHASL